MKGLKNTCIIRALALFSTVTLLAVNVCSPINADEDVVGPMVEFITNTNMAPVLPYSEPIGPGGKCADGHSMVLRSVLRDSTCCSAGVSLYVCDVCGYQEERPEPVIDSTKHYVDEGTLVKKPTLTEPGEIEYKCINCDLVVREEIIPIITKRDTPNAIFNPLTGTLYNVPDNSSVALNGITVSDSVSAEINLENMFSVAGEYRITVVANKNDTLEKSDIQEIAVFKPALPVQIMTVNAKSDSEPGYICCADTNMEYKAVNALEWTDCAVARQPVSEGTYLVRYKATGMSLASDPVSVSVKREEESNNITTYNNEINVVETVVKKQPVPTGIKAISAVDGKPGLIIGTDATMQYKSSAQPDWIDITSDSVSVPVGSYHLRRKGTDGSEPSDIITIIIKSSKSAAKGDKTTTDSKSEDKEDKKPVEKPSVKEKTDVKDETDKVNEDSDKTIIIEKKEPDNSATDSDSDEKSVINENDYWGKIISDMESSSGIVTIELRERTAIPAEVFIKAAETGNSLEVLSGDSARWYISPEDINVKEVELLGSINLGIDKEAKNIPKEAINSISDGREYQTVDSVFDIMHEGNFGFKARFTVKVPRGTPSEYAGLFCYNPLTSRMEYVDTSVVNEDKEATFTMNHASGYAVVVSPKMLSQKSVKEPEIEETDEQDILEAMILDDSVESKNKKKTNPAIAVGLVSVFVLFMIAFLVYALSSKKDDVSFGGRNKKE